MYVAFNGLICSQAFYAALRTAVRSKLRRAKQLLLQPCSRATPFHATPQVVLPWVVVYIVLGAVVGGQQGVVGILPALRQFLWIPIG